MFPTFISILDIQSWWEVPCIAHFCSLFRAAFNLLDFDIEDLEEALLTDGTEETSWLQELIVRLLSGCLANNDISTFNYQMFLRRLFRQKCQEHDRYNPFNTDIDFQLLPLRTKVEILQALCDFRLDADDVLDHLKNLEADSLRVEPLGYDDNDSAYWYFYGTRLYREDLTYKNSKKAKSVWQVICFTEDDWYQLTRKFRKASSKAGRHLHRTLTENFLPELPRLFQEKEALHRKRLLEWLPRRTSSRLDTKRQQQQQQPDHQEKPEKQNKEEHRAKEDPPVVEPVIDQDITKDKARKKRKPGKRKESEEKERHEEEMAARRKQRELRALNRDKSRSRTASDSESVASRSNTPAVSVLNTTVGRQTNNSLASATGQIVIQSVSNPNRKKLKTSQVFRQTEEDLQTGMYKILESVKNNDDAWPFVEPVEEEYAPNYYTIIRKPMDLQRMEDKLDAGEYLTFSKFKADFQLIVDNCRLYNGSNNEYTEMVDNLQQVFQRSTDRYLDQVSSSDEEVAVEFQRTGRADRPPPSVQKRKKIDTPVESLKRKPMSLAQASDRCSERSASVASSKHSEGPEIVDKTKSEKSPKKVTPVNNQHKLAKAAKPATKKSKPVQSPVRTKRKSPPPAVPSPIPERPVKNKAKQKSKEKVRAPPVSQPPPQPPPPPPLKDKNYKLRETIEKLKAKSEVVEPRIKVTERTKKVIKAKTKPAEPKVETSETPRAASPVTTKNVADINALDAATEQTLKDINKWLDDRPKSSEFSSASNSPSHLSCAEDVDYDLKKSLKAVQRSQPQTLQQSSLQPSLKEVAKRRMAGPKDRPPRRRELQRTIDRLQPGKSKGNLLSNMSALANKPEELFPLGPLSKLRENSKQQQDDTLPKLSLGKVLDSFGQQRGEDSFGQQRGEDSFGQQRGEDGIAPISSDAPGDPAASPKVETTTSGEVSEPTTAAPTQAKTTSRPDNKATPNLSAWFKAFGAPKAQMAQRRKPDSTEAEAATVPTVARDSPAEPVSAPAPAPSAEQRPVPVAPVEQRPPPVEEPPKSPGRESPAGQPGIVGPGRPRRGSTGSSMSERSSFSQDLDSSPRMTIDERLCGAYPAPYPSPLHRSPASASPVCASPRQEYPALNGSIRVGFYQDTAASAKSSPDKSTGSPRDVQPRASPSPPPIQQQHYGAPELRRPSPPTTVQQHQQQQMPPHHVYSGMPQSPLPPPYFHHHQQQQLVTSVASQHLEMEQSMPAYYDTSRPLTDQYNSNHQQNVIGVSSPPLPVTNVTTQPMLQQPMKPTMQQVQEQPVPVKKRLYTERDDAAIMKQLHDQLDSRYPSTTVASSDMYDNSGGGDGRAPSYAMTEERNRLDLVGYLGSPPPATPPAPPSHPPPSSSAGPQYGYGARPETARAPAFTVGNLAGLSHLVDRFPTDDRLLAASNPYSPHSHYATSSTGPGSTGMFGGQSTTMGLQYGRPELLTSQSQQTSTSPYAPTHQPAHQPSMQEKKLPSRKRKTRQQQQQQQQQPSPTLGGEASHHQGFQAYAGLKNTTNAVSSGEGGRDPISLKTASVVPGSAFNFGPGAPALGLYSDKDGFLLDEFHHAAAAAHHHQPHLHHAHHRSQQGPGGSAQPQPQVTAAGAGQQPPPPFPFLGHPAQRGAPAYPAPLGAPFMGAHQGPPPSPSALYQQYLHSAGVLHQGLLAPTAGYPPAYHPALGIRQPYDSMTRPSWL